MRGLVGVVSVLMFVQAAWAGEVHTRTTAGTWGSDPARGVMRASIPNDTGYSFWMLGPNVPAAGGTTVIAQIRFMSHVDYGGAGVALVDPNATNQTSPNVRIELSEREDTVGVGGWLANENHFTGSSKKAGKDIALNQWYELALRVDGTRVWGYLDGAEIFSGEIPEVAKLPQTLTVAPFVIEGDVEVKVTVQPGQPRAAPPTTNGRVQIAAYGHDDTDGSDVYWDTAYPHPSMDDDPRRSGKPNAAWDASYDIRGDKLCVRVDNLRAAYPPTNTLAIGYTVTIDGRTRTIVVLRFTGTPRQTSAEVCEPLAGGGAASTGSGTPATIPTTSRPQAEIERDFRDKMRQAHGAADIPRLFPHPEELFLIVADHKLVLDPYSQQWLHFDRVHKTWEPTGFGPGDARFEMIKGRFGVTRRKGARLK